MTKYTVVLLTPEYLCTDGNGYGQEIYVALCYGDSTVDAVRNAKREAYDAHLKDFYEGGPPRPRSLQDYRLCVMFEGHHDVKLFVWQPH